MSLAKKLLWTLSDYPIGALHGRSGGVGGPTGDGKPLLAIHNIFVTMCLLTRLVQIIQSVPVVLWPSMERATAIIRYGGNCGNRFREGRSTPASCCGTTLSRSTISVHTAMVNSFVLWFDDLDGGDGADHNPNIPNIGINVRPNRDNEAEGKNAFMVRIGSENTAFSNVEVKGDHTYLIVAKLSEDPIGSVRRL